MRFAFGSPRATTATTAVTGFDPATVNSVLELKWADGDADTLGALTDGQIVVDADWAQAHDLAVGDAATFTTPLGRQAELRARRARSRTRRG